MTMPFKVKDAALLAGRAPGDLVTAHLMVGGTDAWLATLEKTGAAPRLLSVSFDPEHDTAAALNAHAKQLAADPILWRFATAPPEVVDRFAATFGVNVIREKDRTITHNLRTAVIGPDGRVVKVYDGNDWTTAQVLDDLRHALTR